MRYNQLICFDVSIVLRKQIEAVRGKENGKEAIKSNERDTHNIVSRSFCIVKYNLFHRSLFPTRVLC